MSKGGIIAVTIICTLIVLLLGVVIYFTCVPSGVEVWNNWRHNVQDADDRTNYETLKRVEDTCRSMIASYNSDKLTYQQYKDSDKTPNFESALRNLFEKTGLVIPLLASQVAHFFNPDLPIYSGSVLKGLNIDDTAKGIKDPESKINEACKVYNALTDSIHEFRDGETGQEIIAGFKSVFNQHPRIIQNITDTKIIDFYFWLPTLDEEK